MQRLGLFVVGALLITVISIIAVVATGSDSSAGPVDDAMGLMPADAERFFFSVHDRRVHRPHG